MKICFMKLRDAVRLIALFGMVVSVIAFGIGIKVANNYKSQDQKEVAKTIEVSVRTINETVTEELSTSDVELSEKVASITTSTVLAVTKSAQSTSETTPKPEDSSDADQGISISDQGIAEKAPDTEEEESVDYSLEAEVLVDEKTVSTDRHRSRRGTRREARGQTMDSEDKKDDRKQPLDVDNDAEDSVSGVDLSLQTQINSSMSSDADVDIVESSNIGKPQDEDLKADVPSSNESDVESLSTTTTQSEPDASEPAKVPSNEADIEASGSEVTFPREVVATDADYEIQDLNDQNETDAVKDVGSSEEKVEIVDDESPSSAEVSDAKGDGAASTDASSEEISNRVYVAGLFSIFLFLIGFGANCILLEAVRKEKSVLLPFWMLWCGFAILYMFSGIVISGVEAKYGHLFLFMFLLAMFSYFLAVVYSYRIELTEKYDVKPVEMNRLDKRYGGLGLLNVSGEGDNKV